jgi:hypothetical protein
MPLARSRNTPEPTWVSRVEDALRAADDFMSFAELAAATSANTNRLTAALHHLRKYRAVDSIDSGGRLYWFATPNTDTRCRRVELRRPEEPGTRRRASKARRAPLIVTTHQEP